MSQDDIRKVTVDMVMLIDDDREGVRDAVTDAVRMYVAVSNGHLFLRMHPEAWNKFIPNVSAGLYPLSNEAQAAVNFICNRDQEPGFLSISFSTVAGDVACG